jgi:broad specificity phosphatase PhoE
MVRELFLIRHGQTAWNAARRLQGWNDNPLDETGRAQVRAMGRYLRAHALAEQVGRGERVGLWSSPIARAVESVGLLAQAAGLPGEAALHAGLREFDLGEWSGALVRDLEADPRWQAFLTDPAQVRFPGGEAFVETQRRGRAAAEEILQTSEAAANVVVSHGGLIKSVVLSLLGLPASAYRLLHLSNASLTHVQWTPARGFSLRCINQTVPMLG